MEDRKPSFWGIRTMNSISATLAPVPADHSPDFHAHSSVFAELGHMRNGSFFMSE